MDFKELGANLGLEEDEFIELVELFITTASGDLDKLEAACENDNANKASEAAHSLKGSAGNLGFTEISNVAAIAEKTANQNNLEDTRQLISTMKENLESINSSL